VLEGEPEIEACLARRSTVSLHSSTKIHFVNVTKARVDNSKSIFHAEFNGGVRFFLFSQVNGQTT